MVAPGYTTAQVPFIERLSPDEVAMIRMPLTIDMGTGGSSEPTSYSTRKAGGRVKKGKKMKRKEIKNEESDNLAQWVSVQ